MIEVDPFTLAAHRAARARNQNAAGAARLPAMTTYLLVQLNDDGTAVATQVTDPISVTQDVTVTGSETISVPLAALLPAPALAAVVDEAPVEPATPPTEAS